jgi:NADH:ubiquinone oxidoreductase subunit 2 (subunit N)
MELDLIKRYRTMLVLWFALLMSQTMYFLFSLFVTHNISNEPNNATRAPLIIALTAVSTLFVIVSFPVKNKLLERSVEKQDLTLVQKAMVVAIAMCEVSALLGLLEHFVVGNREYYLLFLLAAGGMVLHFPRRIQLEAATYKSRNITN